MTETYTKKKTKQKDKILKLVSELKKRNGRNGVVYYCAVNELVGLAGMRREWRLMMMMML